MDLLLMASVWAAAIAVVLAVYYIINKFLSAIEHLFAFIPRSSARSGGGTTSSSTSQTAAARPRPKVDIDFDIATQHEAIGYVRGALEIGAKPGYRFRSFYAQILITYDDPDRNFGMVVLHARRDTKGTHVILSPAPEGQRRSRPSGA